MLKTAIVLSQRRWKCQTHLFQSLLKTTPPSPNIIQIAVNIITKQKYKNFFTVLEEGEGWELHSLVCCCLHKSSFEQVYVIVQVPFMYCLTSVSYKLDRNHLLVYHGDPTSTLINQRQRQFCIYVVDNILYWGPGSVPYVAENQEHRHVYVEDRGQSFYPGRQSTEQRTSYYPVYSWYPTMRQTCCRQQTELH